MRVIRALVLAFSVGICSLWALSPALAQVTIAISVDIEPPPLPIYDQPPIPDTGYLWVPGYWAWDDDVGYYWVPGTWILPPEPELLWTPGYWGWDDGYYIFHEGYWGPHIGFYGGVVYGFGYTGDGYEGGYWRDHHFFYNRSVNNIRNVSITNVYNKTVIINNRTNVSFNGGAGGTNAKPTSEQLAVAKERHVAATDEQTRHMQTAAKDPKLSLASNHGHPDVAATSHPAEFKGSGVVASQPGKPIEALPPQGHSKTGSTNGPDYKKKTGSGTTTGPGTATGPDNKKKTGSGTTTGSDTTTGPGTATGPDNKKKTGSGTTTGSDTTTGPGNKTGKDTRDRKGNSSGSGSGAGSTPEVKKPQASKPPPPPPPPPPPRRPPPPPPPKSKCPPDKKC